MIGIDAIEFFSQSTFILMRLTNQIVTFPEFCKTDSLVSVRVQLYKQITQLIVVVE